MKKSVTIIIVVIVLAAVSGVVWYGQKDNTEQSPSLQNTTGDSEDNKDEAENIDILDPSADEAGWQTYRNEEYGFEVRYPESYSLKTITPEGVIIRPPYEVSELSPYVSVGVYNNIKSLAVSDWMQNSSNAYVQPIEEVMIADKKFIRATEACSTSCVSYIINHNNNIYTISFIAYPPYTDYDNIKQEIISNFNKILASFYLVD